MPVCRSPGSQPTVPTPAWRRGFSRGTESWQGPELLLQPGSPNAECYWGWRRWFGEWVRTRRREKKEWHWSPMPDAPPNARPCYPEGWSRRSGNIHEEQSGTVLWDVVCIPHCQDSAAWPRRSCSGTCLELPEGQSLGKRENTSIQHDGHALSNGGWHCGLWVVMSVSLCERESEWSHSSAGHTRLPRWPQTQHRQASVVQSVWSVCFSINAAEDQEIMG